MMPGAMGAPWMPPMMMMQHPNMMMNMPGMFGMPPPPMPLPAAAAGAPTSAVPHCNDMISSQWRRAESADLKEITVTSNLGMLHSLSYSSGLSSFSESKAAHEKLGLLTTLDLSESAEKPSLGLKLKKTPSLMNIINCSLERAMKGEATVSS
jgi:hypothetical protein